jgi:hypothetical protein
VNLLAPNADFSRRLDSKLHATTFDVDNGDNNSIANHQTFTFLATEHEHGFSLPFEETAKMFQPTPGGCSPPKPF